MLDELGLDAVTRAVYTAMLADPAVGVTDLAARLARTETEIRGALDQLVDLSLVRPSREHVGRLLPVSLAVGLQTLLRRQENELAARRRDIDAGQAAARLISDQARDGRGQASPTGPRDVERLIGLDAVQARLEELGAGAKVEVLSLVPGKAIPAEALAAAKAGDSDLGERGVPVRVLYQDAVRNDPATVAYGLWMARRGTRIRTTPLLPQRLLIVDRQVAMVPLDPGDPSAGAVCTTNPGLVDQLVAFFEQIWADATPLEEPRPVESDTGLTSVERKLLVLLAAGSTDEAAAKRLGVSGRTVRRIMADLMERLDASSRFEAGMRAKERGWL